MKLFYLLFFQTICTCLLVAQEREVSILKNDWKFKQGYEPLACEKDFDDIAWEAVSIPHDWAISGPFIKDGDGNTGKLPWKGESWYRTQIHVDKSWEGKHIYLICDGIMAFPKIYVNGTLVGKWDYGYNSFYIDITKFIHLNETNVLSVHADTKSHDSRWYPGAGIFRKISLVKVHPVHIDIWGTMISTPIIKPHYSDVLVKSRVNNKLSQKTEILIKYSILNQKGFQVASTEQKAALVPNRTKQIETTLTLSNPIKWDTSNPYLYQLKTEVYRGDQLIDATLNRFGVRKIRFTADHGFYLNDRRVQLKGVNLHHDLGPLGAAFNKRAMQRQLEIMKGMGCNAIRNSHNTAAPELLDLCDEMGLLVFNEVFDKWDAKAGISDTTDFERFAHRNIRNFILRDYNHPSIFLWSVGNEIGDVQWNLNNGFSRLQTMVNYVRKYDSTRPVTLVCDHQESARLRHFDYYDVHAWNYGRRYNLARQLEPNKSVIISESASTLSTRGFYEFPLPEQKTDFTNSLQVSSYDLNAPWWAEIADDDFMWQQEEEYIAGEFVWTGFDYLGEPTPYNNQWVNEHGMTDTEASRSSYFGIVDLCGIPKDRFYLYKSYWKPEDTTLHILPHWNWPDRVDQITPVFAYTNGDCAELFVNGISQGMKCKKAKSTNSTERFRLMWKDVIYQAGEISVTAYKEGKIISEKTIHTAGKAQSLKMTADRTHLKANEEDLSYILIEAFDKKGRFQPLADDLLHITISGTGELAGVCNGNPQSTRSFTSDRINLFYGKAMIIVRSTEKQGEIQVSVSSESLQGASCSLLCEK